MFFHLFLTSECNLECRYCFGEALEDVESDFCNFNVEYSLPKTIVYSLEVLNSFCSLDPECVLIFYGGEPLLRIEDVKQIMDNVKAKHFILQTNGIFLDRLDKAYVNRLSVILVSIDGDEALTDFYRGKGVFRKVVENLKLIKRNGFKGEIIARMTVMEQTEIYKQVRRLLNNSGFTFDAVHWQLNAGFWSCDFQRRNFKKWIEENYNPGIRRLAKFWVDTMEREELVLRLYPFMGVAQSLLLGEQESPLRCGAGWINYAIQTDGTIIPCPSMWGMRDFYLGHIKDAHPLKLEKIIVDEPCISCKIFNLCGGRCLYANITKRWKTEAYKLVCETVENMINALEAETPRIKELIKTRKIKKENFDFMKYNGAEIIP